MTTEQYSIGHEEGYQAGWNDAMESLPAQQEPVASVTVENGVCATTRSANFSHIPDGQYQLYVGPLQNDVVAAIATLKAIGYVYNESKTCKEGEQWVSPQLAPVQQESVRFKCTVIDDEHPGGVPLERWGQQPAPQAPAWWPAVENILNEYGLQAIDFVADFKEALALSQQEPVCQWNREDDDDHMPGTWRGDCGALWTFTDGSPVDNNMKYCCGCGAILLEKNT